MRVLSKCALLLVALTASSCSDQPTTGPARSPAELAFAVMAPAYISTLSLEVTGPGIDSALTFNVTVTNGVGTGTLRVPAGAGRRIVGRAFDAVGVNTHRGDTTVTLVEGTNPSVTLTLTPLMGGLPISVGFGSNVVAVNRRDTTIAADDTLRFTATAVRARGGAVPADSIVWATTNPAVATVEGGLVTGVTEGIADIVASYEGAAARRRVQIGPPIVVRPGLGILLVSKEDLTTGCADCFAYLIREDGSLLRNIGTDILEPDLSPDASRLTFTKGSTGRFELWVGDTAGVAAAVVGLNLPFGRYWSPRWSYDGERIAFAAETNGGWQDGLEIWRIKSDGSEAFRLTYNSIYDLEPDWSIDGLRIAFLHFTSSTGMNIWTVYADGSTPTAVTTDAAQTCWEYHFPRYSPDGTRLLFAGCSSVFTSMPDGTDRRLVFHDPVCPSLYPAWSPDSRRIAFSGCTASGNRDVFIINADGTGLTNITNTPTVNEYVWRWR